MNIIDSLNSFLSTYVLVAILLGAGLFFTFYLGGVQFRMIPEMLRLLFESGRRHEQPADLQQPASKSVTSFQAFALSLAARVGTGNIAGVAIAITLGGPGAIFWMWVTAIIGAASAFVESTLAQLYKVKGEDEYRGGPAYYILKGTGKRWWAVLFAILITITFGLAFNSVQANTIDIALKATFGFDGLWVAIALAAMAGFVICGGVHRISRFTQVVVPVMAIGYILLALYVIIIRYEMFPVVLKTIIENAFGVHQAVGGSIGMALIIGVKRGLFSNEAGEGSTPNAAAAASVTHPVKQGLIQTFGVYTDTLLVCTATAFIILCSGAIDTGLTGMELTQAALQSEIGSVAAIYLTVALFLFAFTSIVANYYYGETNIAFINSRKKWMIYLFRAVVTGTVFFGAIAELPLVWALADITMALMTCCNVVAILVLGKYARRCLKDYVKQKKDGKDPAYTRNTIPEIADKTECWPEQ